MRTITVIISLFITLAFLGCRESLVSQPESPVYAEKSTLNTNGLIKGEINICCASYDPYSGECKINGKVTYLHKILEYSEYTRIKLDLEMDAELCTKLMNPARYTIYGTCCDTLLIDNSGKLLLDKTYSVENRPDLRFCVQYSVTNESVSIMQMNLLQIVDPD